MLTCAGYLWVTSGVSLIRGEVGGDVPFSGPQQGEVLPPLKINLAYGESRGQTIDLVAQADGRPTLLVIVHGSNRPAARLTRILMNYSEMRQDKLFAGTVYLDEDLSGAQQALQRGVSWWGVGPPVGISVDGAEGPGSYGFNRKVNLTVIVAHKGRVTANFALVQPSETDAPKILKSVVALIGGNLPGRSELMFLSVPTRKPNVQVRWRSAPRDVRLRRLICAALASKDEHQATLAADAIDLYVAQNADRQAALGDAANILLQGRTRIRGQPVVKHLREWRTQHDVRPSPKR